MVVMCFKKFVSNVSNGIAKLLKIISRSISGATSKNGKCIRDELQSWQLDPIDYILFLRG